MGTPQRSLRETFFDSVRWFTHSRSRTPSEPVVTSRRAEVPSAPLGAGSSLRRAIPRGFVQDDKWGESGIGVSAVPTGLGSLSLSLPRTYLLGYRMPPLRGCSCGAACCAL